MTRVPTEHIAGGAVAAALLLTVSASAHAASASITYGYDELGRVTTALYDNGTCIVYTYDAVGNRTSQTNSTAAGPQTPIWGTGSWGCFQWAAEDFDRRLGMGSFGLAALAPEVLATRSSLFAIRNEPTRRGTGE